jgi:transposase
MNAKQVHRRYKDLAMVEMCFRLSKTGFLEIRPLYVRKANRTRAIAFICMCAYMILREIWQRVQGLNVPLVHIIDRLDQIQLSNIKVKNMIIPMLPKTIANDQQDYLNALGIELPKM